MVKALRRLLGLAALLLVVAAVLIGWDILVRLNDEIDLCLDTTSGRYVGNDHPACRAAAARAGNPDRQFIEGGL
ncbi:hypothetical protein [Jannaschia aquimarina]|uniref:Uncharacterized protein n=1 Tax=Jannaschia aquimarina TaxID=935700 RepID=A0A0D1ECD8_9RHOB|nr:hypothetical protein [Jannaschia aquimarina]KIT14591.1 hypothetical protein jaqu_36690 [Jannaschia aquimarina]SNS76963.1 hypothetical protein SAMN05421775_102220 [Jannaschia aquimarina]